MFKELSGKECIKDLVKDFPQVLVIFERLGIQLNKEDQKKTLVEIALSNSFPLQVILSNLGKKLNIPVKWPKVSGVGEHFQDDFTRASGLRKGKPVGIKKIIAIHSGKGGVGKTVISVLLANFLNNKKFKVGLLDLDIDCPNLTLALGINERHIANKDKLIQPINFNGIKVISMGAIQKKAEDAIMWRGPVLAKAIEQLFFDADWGEIDYLIVDFPPGTSEAPLTFFNIVKPDGVIIISTPQKLAIYDAAKSVDMCNTMKVPVIGVIENMTGDIFGQSNEKLIESVCGVKFLGEIPLNPNLSKEKFWEDDRFVNKIFEKISF